MTTMRLTIKGETRDVEVRDVWAYLPDRKGERFDTVKPVGLYRKREGAKTWHAIVTFWRQADGSYRASFETTILNRSGYRLIGFAEDREATSQHNSHRRAQ
jgi:hypothetical protein